MDPLTERLLDWNCKNDSFVNITEVAPHMKFMNRASFKSKLLLQRLVAFIKVNTCAFIIDCCVTNHHRLIHLKQDTFIIS